MRKIVLVFARILHHIIDPVKGTSRNAEDDKVINIRANGWHNRKKLGRRFANGIKDLCHDDLILRKSIKEFEYLN